MTRELRGDEATQPVLTDDEVRELAELGRRIEEHYGSAQDTEWAIDADGKAWMLQSRPVTSAGGDARRGAGRHDGEVLVRGLGAAPGVGCGTSASSRARRCGRARRGRDPRHPHDRARLGAADAALGGDRHRLRRHDLPRGDRLARARHPVRGRHRRGDDEAARRRAGHRRRGPGRRLARARSPSRRARRRGRPGGAARPRRSPATKLLVNLSEPSQVERASRARRRGRRAAACRADGARGARGQAPAPADRGGRSGESSSTG